MYISFNQSLLLFEALYKNLKYFNFLSIPSAFDYLGSHKKVSLGVKLELKRPLTQAWGCISTILRLSFKDFGHPCLATTLRPHVGLKVEPTIQRVVATTLNMLDLKYNITGTGI
jgi:hypothetical protein